MEYECDTQFKLVGSKEIECLDGQWSPPPSCIGNLPSTMYIKLWWCNTKIIKCELTIAICSLGKKKIASTVKTRKTLYSCCGNFFSEGFPWYSCPCFSQSLWEHNCFHKYLFYWTVQEILKLTVVKIWKEAERNVPSHGYLSLETELESISKLLQYYRGLESLATTLRNLVISGFWILTHLPKATLMFKNCMTAHIFSILDPHRTGFVHKLRSVWSKLECRTFQVQFLSLPWVFPFLRWKTVLCIYSIYITLFLPHKDYSYTALISASHQPSLSLAQQWWQPAAQTTIITERRQLCSPSNQF